jgi:hypothetical protein
VPIHAISRRAVKCFIKEEILNSLRYQVVKFLPSRLETYGE